MPKRNKEPDGGPEALLAEIARMGRRRRRGRRPLALLLAALTVLGAALALGVSGWTLAAAVREGPAAGVLAVEDRAREAAERMAAALAARTPRFQWPCRGRITSPFGPRTLFGTESLHRGTDIAAPQGTEIRAAAGGRVIFAGEKGTYGNLVQVDHGGGTVTCYAHCSEILVEEGARVEQGQALALVGATGRATGPHCHFEVRQDGTPVDPAGFLP